MSSRQSGTATISPPEACERRSSPRETGPDNGACSLAEPYSRSGSPTSRPARSAPASTDITGIAERRAAPAGTSSCAWRVRSSPIARAFGTSKRVSARCSRSGTTLGARGAEAGLRPGWISRRINAGAQGSRLRGPKSMTGLTCSRSRPSNHFRISSMFAPASRSRRWWQRGVGVRRSTQSPLCRTRTDGDAKTRDSLEPPSFRHLGSPRPTRWPPAQRK